MKRIVMFSLMAGILLSSVNGTRDIRTTGDEVDKKQQLPLLKKNSLLR
jgi:hypothetical protein